MSDVKQKALELVESVNKQILEAREDLMKQMVEKNLLPENYIICDNMLDIVEGSTLQYKCWAAAKTNKPKI